MDDDKVECNVTGKMAPSLTMINIHESQAYEGISRHKCAICAYHAGITEGIRRAKAEIEALLRTARGE